MLLRRCIRYNLAHIEDKTYKRSLNINIVNAIMRVALKKNDQRLKETRNVNHLLGYR